MGPGTKKGGDPTGAGLIRRRGLGTEDPIRRLFHCGAGPGGRPGGGAGRGRGFGSEWHSTAPGMNLAPGKWGAQGGCRSWKGKGRGPGPSLRQRCLSFPTVPGCCVRSLCGGGATAARGPLGSGSAASGAGRMWVPGARCGPGRAAGGAAGTRGRGSAVRRASGSAAECATALRAPPRGPGPLQQPCALLRASSGSAGEHP